MSPRILITAISLWGSSAAGKTAAIIPSSEVVNPITPLAPLLPACPPESGALLVLPGRAAAESTMRR